MFISKRGGLKISRSNLEEAEKNSGRFAHKMLKGSVAKSKEHGAKLNYYRENRSEALNELAKKFGDQKGPAVSGIVVLLPVAIVFLFVGWFFQRINWIPGIELLNLTNIYVVDQSLKLGVILTVGAILVTLTGKFVKTDSGFQAERFVDSLFSSIPFLGVVYRMTKVIAETATGGAKELRKPVKLEINGMRVTAFKTGNKTSDNREIVFLPTSPNITTGFTLEVQSEDIIETNETAEQALIRTLSAGFGQHRDAG